MKFSHFFAVVFLSGLGSELLAQNLLQVHSPRPLQAESTMAALESWETPIDGFFIRSHHPVPAVDASRWTIIVDGLVAKPLKLTLNDLKRFKKSSLHAVLECAGNGRGLQSPTAAGLQWNKGAVGNAEWGGVVLADILKRAGVLAKARFIRIEGADHPAHPSVPGFIRSIPLAKANDPSTLIAWEMNRGPMPILHGGPARLILPNWYGENWLKWVTRITLQEEEDQGFFQKKGYRMPKTPVKPGEKWDSATGATIDEIRVQSLIVAPLAGATVDVGPLNIRGKAFSGGGAIAKVEISLDRGRSWQAATVEAPHKSGGWQSFTATGDIAETKKGKLEIWSRATDANGQTQPEQHEWNPSGYLRNAIDAVEVEVATTTMAAAHSILNNKCYSCHDQALIENQRLSRKQWEGVLAKMQNFGVALTDSEKATLLENFPEQAPTQSAPLASISYQNEARKIADRIPAGGSPLGKKLYAQNCSSCHGAKGEGQIGPRLAGRAIPSEDFSTIVRRGRGEMPSLAAVLKDRDISSIRQYLMTANY